MRRLPLTLHLTLTYLLVTLVGMLALGSVFVIFFGLSDAAQRARELQSQAVLLAEYTADIAAGSDLSAVASTLVDDPVLPQQVTLRVFDASGGLLAASADLGPFPSRSARALLPTPLPLLPTSEAADRRFAAALIPNQLGVIELSRDLRAEQALLRNLLWIILRATLIALVLIGLVSFLVARGIANPVQRLNELALALASGELARRAIPQGANEIATLARSLNAMADQLQARLQELEQQRARLDNVLTSISEGVIALDASGQPLLANPAALQLLGVEAAQLPAFLAEQHLSGDPQAREVEIELGGRIVLINRTPARSLPNQIQIGPLPASVLVIRDLTRLRALEQARTQFFRNVSHDLRTPLTSIRGALENMADQAAPAERERLVRLEAEAARLARLVDQLLSPPPGFALSLHERRPLDFAALVRDLSELQQPRAQRRGVQLCYEIPAGLPAIAGDRDRLRQAVLNLLDNALKFTPAGGTVWVTLQSEAPRGLLLTIADNGPGVPPELGERIWERGERGEQGGAGLGLAIVREIVTAHHGRAWHLPNSPQGTRFLLWLPTTA